MNKDASNVSFLKRELIRDTVENAIYRIVYIAPDLKTGYWIRTDSNSNIPKLIDLSEIGKGLSTRTYETVVDVTIEDKNISESRIAERDRIFGLIKDIVSIEPSIYERFERASILRDQATKTGVAVDKLYHYLGKYWRDGMTPNAMLPKYNMRGNRISAESSKNKRGRVKKEGENGKILTSEDKEIFAATINEYYSSDKKPTLTQTYDWMIAHKYSKPRFKGDTNPEQLSPDEKPSFRQFSYWYSKNKNVVEEAKEREKNRYETTCRGVVGSSSSFVKGPGMTVQIDATIADYYLVKKSNRNVEVGRPVMFFIKDVRTRMITGMYVTLENSSWDCALMALKNSTEDKVTFCKKYGIDITPDQWPCHHLPVSITADNGEMGDKGVEEIIAKLGITVENTPPYRGDLKGIIERNFGMIDMNLRYIVPGHVDKNAGERGSIDRRKEACIDIETFTGMIIRCVLFHNNHHWMDNYEMTPDMLNRGVTAIPRDLWNYGMQFESGALRTVPKDQIYRVLLPKGKAVVTDRGIHCNNLWYTCEYARKNNWFDKARLSGRWDIPITYDPTCVNHIYFSDIDGQLIQCDLLDKSNMHAGSSIDDIADFDARYNELKASMAQQEEKAKTNLILEVETIVERCQKEKKDEGQSAVNSVLNKHNLRNQRNTEKEEQSGAAAAMEMQDELGVVSDSEQTDGVYDTAGDAFDEAIDDALREAGLF